MRITAIVIIPFLFLFSCQKKGPGGTKEVNIDILFTYSYKIDSTFCGDTIIKSLPTLSTQYISWIDSTFISCRKVAPEINKKQKETLYRIDSIIAQIDKETYLSELLFNNKIKEQLVYDINFHKNISPYLKSCVIVSSLRFSSECYKKAIKSTENVLKLTSLVNKSRIGLMSTIGCTVINVAIFELILSYLYKMDNKENLYTLYNILRNNYFDPAYLYDAIRKDYFGMEKKFADNRYVTFAEKYSYARILRSLSLPRESIKMPSFPEYNKFIDSLYPGDIKQKRSTDSSSVKYQRTSMESIFVQAILYLDVLRYSLFVQNVLQYAIYYRKNREFSDNASELKSVFEEGTIIDPISGRPFYFITSGDSCCVKSDTNSVSGIHHEHCFPKKK